MHTKERVITFLFLFFVAALGLFASAYAVPLVFGLIFHLGSTTYKAIVCWQVLVQVVGVSYIAYKGMERLKERYIDAEHAADSLKDFEDYDEDSPN